jgi:hypothetical protein
MRMVINSEFIFILKKENSESYIKIDRVKEKVTKEQGSIVFKGSD